MNTHDTARIFKGFLGLGALAACAALTGPVQAKNQPVTIKIPVSYAGLDLTQPAGAQDFYHRLQSAAYIACTHGRRVDLKPLLDPSTCYEKALADAIRSAKQPQLTMVYLKTHSPEDATARGIEVPVLVASK